MDNKLNDTQSDNIDETKRKSLIKMGKRAAYVAPAVMTLLTSANATVGSMTGMPGTGTSASSDG